MLGLGMANIEKTKYHNVLTNINIVSDDIVGLTLNFVFSQNIYTLLLFMNNH